uniref:F-box domain-containing protein n=1 Tax=Cuerna arida TaxID=1464854 RepID=A0A1B6ERZ9_9HEMI
MEPAGLLSLPIEVVHHLSSFLSVEDVLSCSLTCHYLRLALNDNTVWKRYLPEQDLTRLESMEQHVQPTFQLGQTLTPLCDNRIHFMRKTRILNNWREGNFVEFSETLDFTYADALFNRRRGQGQLIYKDRYLFLSRFVNDIESNAIEIWDMVQDPILFTSIEIDDVNYDSFFIIGTKLVVIKCIKVDVYEITVPDKTFPLIYSFIITEENVVYNKKCHHTGLCDDRCVGWSHYAAGQYLLCNKCGHERHECILHVWNISSATKSGTFLSPRDGFSVNLYSFVGNELILKQCVQCSSDQYYFHFDIKNQMFSDTVFEYKEYADHMIFHKSYVIVFRYDGNSDTEYLHYLLCILYNFFTSSEIKRRRFKNRMEYYGLNSTTVIDGKFVLICNDYFHIIDVCSLETIDRFKCNPDVVYITHQINLHGSLFIITADTNSSLGLWDVEKKKKVNVELKSSRLHHLYVNELCTVLVSFDFWKRKLRILHCW